MNRILPVLLLLVLAFPAIAQTVTYDGIRQDAIVDVRTPAEFQAGHIKGAVNIPLNTIESGIQAVHGINKDSQILLYCRSGRRSALARKLLAQQGFRHVQDGGGIGALEAKLKACNSHQC
jgi:phage shock protein E